MADKVAYSMDEELVNKLLKLYLSHCKFKHAFAFIQFRKLLPNAKVQDLVEMFSRRKKHLIMKMEKVNHLIE